MTKKRTIYFPTLAYAPVPENKNVRFSSMHVSAWEMGGDGSLMRRATCKPRAWLAVGSVTGRSIQQRLLRNAHCATPSSIQPTPTTRGPAPPPPVPGHHTPPTSVPPHRHLQHRRPSTLSHHTPPLCKYESRNETKRRT